MSTKRDNRATREEIAEREERLKREKYKKEQLHVDRVRLMQLPEFQRVMADILDKGGMFQSVMTGNSMTYWNSGRQDFAREIWADLASANLDLAHDLLKPKNEEI